MGIVLSILKNEVKKNLSIVILCAGEGTRLKKITKTTPKPLIKIEPLNSISILYYNIKTLLNFEIDKIAIVIGHLGVSIREYLTTIKKNDHTLQDKLIIIDTENQYKLGPLYSFLSITKNKSFFTRNNYYLVIPGDTIFDYSILKEIIYIISKNYTLIHKYPFVFYRIIGLKTLEELYSINRIISNAEITKLGSEIILKKISQLKIRDILSENTLIQLIPITALSYDSINEILNMNRENLNKTIWETLNSIIFNGKKVLAFEIENKHQFYDIDNKKDLKNLKKKKDNRCSD